MIWRILVYLVLSSLFSTVASGLPGFNFHALTTLAPWTARAMVQVLDLQNTSILGSPDNTSAWILYGGTTDPQQQTVINDLWLSLDTGYTWVSLPNSTDIFPTTPGSIFCSDFAADRIYAMTYNSSIRTTTTFVNWTLIRPQLGANSSNLTLPFVDRYKPSCLVDGQSNLYYLLGTNLTAFGTHPQLYADSWISSDHGQIWAK